MARAEIISFVIRETKKKIRPKTGKEELVEEIIHPWQDVKELEGYEWIKDAATAIAGETRDIESATYIAVRENEPVFLTGHQAPYTHYNVAVFQDNRDGKIYEIAERLASIRDTKVGDVAALRVLGCCSVMDIIKKEKTALEEDQGGIKGSLEE